MKDLKELLNVPNALTASRLLLAFVIVYCLVHDMSVVAFALFIVAALTDWLDGLAARTFGVGTKFGAYFDPIADKVLLDLVLVALGRIGAAPQWFVAIVLIRDAGIVLSALFFLKFTDERNFPPSMPGKFSTIAQCVAVILLLNIHAFVDAILYDAWPLFVVASAALTIWSAIDYLWRGMRIWQKARI